ncbi:MAG: type VII secretion integral membrane protein EccD [Gordonia sp. (in: high G+C Gram-positive bacteria)]
MTSVDTTIPVGSPGGEISEAPPGPALVRVSVLGGNTQLDVALPTMIPIAALIVDLAAAVAARDRAGAGPDDSDAVPDAPQGRWTLAPIGRAAFPTPRTLADCGVCDGDLLLLTTVDTGSPPALFDDVIDAVARLNSASSAAWSARSARLLGLVMALVFSATGALSLVAQRHHDDSVWPTIPAAAVTLGVLVAAALVARHTRDQGTATVLSVSALPPAGVVGGLAVPSGSVAAAVGLGCFSVLLTSVVGYRLTGSGPVAHSAVLTAAGLGGLVALGAAATPIGGAGVAALGAAAGLFTIAMAPRLTIALAKLPVPPVPTAGAPLADDEPEPSPTIEGIGAVGAVAMPRADALQRRAHLANAYLTGMTAGAGVVVVVTALCCATPWSGLDPRTAAYAAVVGGVVALRGRSHTDLVQACVLVAGGGLILAVLIGAPAVTGGQLPLIGFGVATTCAVGALALGVLAPRHDFSPVLRRCAELAEYLLVALVVPLLAWILDLYQVLRDI